MFIFLIYLTFCLFHASSIDWFFSCLFFSFYLVISRLYYTHIYFAYSVCLFSFVIYIVFYLNYLNLILLIGNRWSLLHLRKLETLHNNKYEPKCYVNKSRNHWFFSLYFSNFRVFHLLSCSGCHPLAFSLFVFSNISFVICY